MPCLGYKYSPEVREQRRLARLGKKHSPETIEKIRQKATGRKCTEETKKKISEMKKGRISKMKGRTHTEKAKRNMSLATNHHGKNNPNWKGGITEKHLLMRNSPNAKKWRMEIFERDNWICQHCNQRGGNLEAHHIKSWRKYPALRFEINNGITYCAPCHSINDLYRNYKNV